MVDIKKIIRRSLGVIVGLGVGATIIFFLLIFLTIYGGRLGLDIDQIRGITDNVFIAYGIIGVSGFLGYFLTDRIPNRWQNAFGFGVVYALVLYVLFFLWARDVPDAGFALGAVMIFGMVLFIMGIIAGFSTRYKWAFILSVVGSIAGIGIFYYVARYTVDLGKEFYPLLIPIGTTLAGSIIGRFITSPSDKRNIRYKNPLQKCPIKFKQKNIITCVRKSK